jgi:Flp pilus assembly CpaF family ATPase
MSDVVLIETDYDLRVRRQREALLAIVQGPIAEGLQQRDVTEVIVDPDGTVLYDYLFGEMEARGRVARARLEAIIVGISGLLDKPIGFGLVQGELVLDGSRIQAWLPPVSPNGPSLVIRKHRRQGVDGWPSLTLDDYEMPAPWRETLETMIDERQNLLIVGSTGSGKTTFAGAFLARVTAKSRVRIVTIEDTAELNITNALSYLPLHSTDSGEKKQITQRMLVKSAMRALPHWLVLGEVRDEAAIDLVEAAGTGHPGVSTVHGGTLEQGLTRVLQLCGRAISPEMVADAFPYVLLMRREPSGPRRVAALAKVSCWRNGRFQFEPLSPNDGKDSTE